MVFYINHYNIEVYLGEENVYQMKVSDGVIRTPGSVWVMVSLHAEDMGKEVRIELSPLYENYQKEVPEIMLGSELAIYQAVLREALPELILSMCVVFAGIFLLGLAIYHHAKRRFALREELEKEKSVGIRNIRFRLKHLVNGSMEITSQVGVGTTVTIRIPKED